MLSLEQHGMHQATLWWVVVRVSRKDSGRTLVEGTCLGGAGNGAILIEVANCEAAL